MKELMKKWRWWVMIPVFMLLAVFILPLILSDIIGKTLSKLVDFSYWFNNKLEIAYEVITPKWVTKKIQTITKWAKQ